MTVHELLKELQALEQDGKGNLEVRFYDSWDRVLIDKVTYQKEAKLSYKEYILIE